MKKLLVSLAALVSAATVCSVQAEEATVKGVSWRYSVVNGEARLDLLNQVFTGKLVVPAKVGKYIVTAVGDGEHPISCVQGPTVIALPASVTSIGAFSLGENLNLKGVSLPAKLTSIPNAAFAACEKLSSVKIPASVKSIGEEAFAECRSLKSITIPEGVEDIGNLAFRDCSSLASVTIPASVTSIGFGAFEKCDKLAKITVARDNRRYKSLSGALYTKDGSTLVEWLPGSPIAEVVIPDGVTDINRYAFGRFCPKVVSITIPASVTNVSALALLGCPKLTVLYTDAGNVNRLKALISAPGGSDLDKVRIEERPAAQTGQKTNAKSLNVTH